MFGLRPDCVLAHKDRIIVADAKLKLIDEHDRANASGTCQASIYQLYAYSAKIWKEVQRTEVWLIYPAHDRFRLPLGTFELEIDGRTLWMLPLNLERGKVALEDRS